MNSSIFYDFTLFGIFVDDNIKKILIPVVTFLNILDIVNTAKLGPG